ncbi:hypothetical protein JHD47_04390 [Sulfurimonas sp. SAG-AH-194-L11]|nr:hypothetical protein [Sulfurimonas sp. SAG-AH-194-L11]MDF1877046.1 hypothetical protein [Sulfurimonas sp. SAG-AH-194-L11]
MKKLTILAFMSLSVFVVNAVALPAFARQLGVSCSACHSQNGYPALNRFGREFKASGYTMVGSQKVITDDKNSKFMSLTETLNMSLMANMSYSKSSSTSATINVPNEASVFIGGRIAEGVGTFTEMGYDAEAASFSLVNMRLPFIYNISDYTVGVVPYLTDADGPSASTNMLNAGSVVSSLGDLFAAQEYVQNGEVLAEGVSLYIYSDLWNAAYSAWIPVNGSASNVEFANFASVAVTPRVGSWDVDVGAEIWWGTSQVQDPNNSSLVIRRKTDSYALKFQARGSISDVPVSFFGDYANASSAVNSLYSVNTNDKYAASLSSEVAVLPRVVMVSAGYRLADNGATTNSSDNGFLLGARYFYRENVQFRIGYMYLLDNTTDKHNIIASLDLAL